MAEEITSRVLIVDYPSPIKVKDSYQFTSNLVKILQSVAFDLWVISDNINDKNLDGEIHIKKIGIAPHFLREIKPRWFSILVWILKSIIIQTKICINILRIIRNVDTVIFFMMQPFIEVVPMFFTKLFRKKIIKVPLMPAPKHIISVPHVYSYFERISLFLADYYVPEYESTVERLKEYGQLSHPEKLLPAAHFFVLEDDFKITKGIDKRENIVGYIGGFRKIKGTVNFANAIPLVLNKYDKIRFLIAGEGVLRDHIANLIIKYPQDRIDFMDWIPHEDLPKYLNDIKLLVIPSYSEGGPTIALEAMACGTPILATQVGLINILIKDGETGFILENNSPDCIARNILRVLKYDDSNLQEVADKAKRIIDDRYTFNSTVNGWQDILG